MDIINLVLEKVDLRRHHNGFDFLASMGELKTLCELYQQDKSNDEIQSLRQQLAVKDLEVMQLREALYQASCQLDLVQPNSSICEVVSNALSTTFTPDYLREWLGDPVAEVVSEKFADFMQPTATLKWIQTEHDVGTKLYAPKLEVK